MSCNSHNLTNEVKTPSTPLPVITVNGVVIKENELAAELQYHQSPNFEVVVQQAGQALVIRQLMFDKAKKEGLPIKNITEEKMLQDLLSNFVSCSEPSEQDCLRYFENNRSKFTTEPLMEVDHILLAAAKEDLPAREIAKNNALSIIQQLKQNPLLFNELAKKYSACPSKQMGGSLGQLSRGQTVPEFERQLVMLSSGLSAKPIESRYGYHVVNVTHKIDGKALDYSMAADKVRGYLTHRASHLSIQAFIQQLIENADIRGITMRFTEENVHIEPISCN